MLIFLITFYQKIISPAFKQLFGMPALCRFTPSCSEYAKISIKQYGVIKGSYRAVLRLLHCQPFATKEFSL